MHRGDSSLTCLGLYPHVVSTLDLPFNICGWHVLDTCLKLLTKISFIFLCRFDDWSSESSSTTEQKNSSDDGYHGRKMRPSVSAVLDSIKRRLENGSDKIKNLKNSSAVHPISDRPPKTLAPRSRSKILDPQGSFLQEWNKIFVITSVMAVSVDPLFFYIPVIVDTEQCLKLDGNLQIIASVLRTFFDLFYVLHIIFQFRTGFIAPSSRVFGRGELVNDPRAIMTRYLSSYFIIDVLSIIPLPQVSASSAHSKVVP